MATTKSSPARGWTPKFIESLRPQEARYEIADPKTPGLRLRVHPSGVKSFCWRVTSLARVIVIGPWAETITPAHVTLAEAWRWLQRLKEARVAGEAQLNAVVTELQAQLHPPERAAGAEEDGRRTFGAVAEDFYKDDILVNRKCPEDARAILDRDVLPFLGARPLDAVTTLECRDVVKRTITRGAVAHAGKVLATLKQLFTWAQANGYTDRNPAAPLKGDRLGVVVNMRDRWLTAEEIPIFWRALDADPGPKPVSRPDPRTGKTQTYEQRTPTLAPATAAATKILLLTAVRTGELLKARWEHLDLKAATWMIPAANRKSTKKQERKAKPWIVPLTPTALGLFEQLQKIAGSSPWVMAGEGDSGHYDAKAFGHALRRLIKAKVLVLPGGPLSPHDLRRTARTWLGKLSVAPHVVERCLGHSLGRIVQTYDQYDYLDERREALTRWDERVLAFISGESNLVFLRPAAQS